MQFFFCRLYEKFETERSPVPQWHARKKLVADVAKQFIGTEWHTDSVICDMDTGYNYDGQCSLNSAESARRLVLCQLVWHFLFLCHVLFFLAFLIDFMLLSFSPSCLCRSDSFPTLNVSLKSISKKTCKIITGKIWSYKKRRRLQGKTHRITRTYNFLTDGVAYFLTKFTWFLHITCLTDMHALWIVCGQKKIVMF